MGARSTVSAGGCWVRVRNPASRIREARRGLNFTLERGSADRNSAGWNPLAMNKLDKLSKRLVALITALTQFLAVLDAFIQGINALIHEIHVLIG